MRKLLWVGDAVVDTGFARCTHRTLEVVKDHFDVQVIGINYRGDPHDYPYKIWPARSNRYLGFDFGEGRLPEVLQKFGPDVVVLQNDPWNIPIYLRDASATFVATMPVDGKNCRGAGLNGLRHAIFWTEFGRREANLGGYTGPASVIPLGVDLDVYRAHNQQDARRGLTPRLRGAFIVGNVNRNQPRKRLDLTIRYFARWVKQHKIDDAYLFLHVAPTGDQGYDCEQLGDYYGISNRLVIHQPKIFEGIEESRLARVYSCFDVQVTTTQGEGWGLCTMEGMACGIPQIVPAWAALEEWTHDCALQVRCSSTASTTNGINVVGGVADEEEFVQALQTMYSDRGVRELYQHRGFSCVQRPQYRWSHVGLKFVEVLNEVLSPVAIPDEVGV